MLARSLALLTCAQGFADQNLTSDTRAGCTGTVVQFYLIRDMKKCLDVRGGQITDGAPLQIWDCNGQSNQNFIWCSDGRIVSAVNDNMCLDVPGEDPYKTKDLQLWQCNSGAHGQYWEFDAKTQSIFPPSSGDTMCVDVESASDTNGASVNIYNCKPGTGERWYFGQGPPPVPPTVAPIPECSGGKGVFKYFQLDSDTSKCLDIAGGKAVKGAQVEIWGCNGLENQKFIWCDDGRIVSGMDDGMCLDVPGGDPSKALNLQIWPCNGANGQYWQYDGNAMAIYPWKTGEKMCMDTNAGSSTPGTKVMTYACNPGGQWEAQRWQVNNVAVNAYNGATDTYINV